jgi:transposase
VYQYVAAQSTFMTVLVTDAYADVQKLVSVVKMATVLEERSVVRFLWAKGLNAKDINKEMFSVYGGKCLSRKAVHNWLDKFCQGPSKVSDDAQPGRPVQIATEAAVQRVEELIPADRKITIDSEATALGCSHGLAYSITHDRLKFRKVCA